jgi:polar amino acid transport system substrate-binding protein
MRLMDVRSDLAPTGTLRASINLGNPVLAQGTPAAPSGVTVDIACELGARLGVPVELICFDAARESFEAMKAGRADICFLAIDPAREETVAFTPPYAVIEGVFAVPEASPLTSSADVDRPGVRVGVKKGSAYDLFLSRTLAHAEVVRGGEGVTVFTEQQLEVAAGIRQPMEVFAAAHSGVRLLEPRFMDPAGRGHHPNASRPHSRLPAYVRRGAQGQWVHCRGPTPRRSARRDRRPTRTVGNRARARTLGTRGCQAAQRTS